MSDLVSLTLDGKICQSLAVTSLSVSQQINEIPSARLTLSTLNDTGSGIDSDTQLELTRCRPGHALAITVDEHLLFSGSVIRQKINLSGKNVFINLEARHVLQNLLSVSRSQVFQNIDDAAILRRLCSEAGIELTLDGPETLHAQQDQLVQFRSTSWHFLRCRMVANNCWLLPDAASGRAKITTMGAAPPSARVLTRRGPPLTWDINDISLEFDNRFSLDTLSVQGWDINEQQLSPEQRASSSAWGGKDLKADAVATPDKRQLKIAFSNGSEMSTSTLALAWFNQRQIASVRGTIEMSGNTDFQPGETLTLSDFNAGLDGTATITGIRHAHDIEQGWRTWLIVGMPVDSHTTVPPVQELHIGIVADFQQDPASLERIPLNVPALSLTGGVLFARLGKPYASRQSGFCFYPEAGDEVIVGFFESDPRYPVILGAMHNPKNHSPFPPDDQNQRKALVVNVDGKVEQLVIDSAENTVALSAGENSFMLQNEKDITLSGQHNLTIKAVNITQQASSALSASGASSVEIKGASINLTK
ncbi:phage baseplate assembly protein V [Erwinia oleae]|uniref:phage baseplate assembly protein V n=1 Tax=Erwinia oleae TaxID=796334 RepID=UPI0006900017|nr:phage baseplate assembly protein V [Erwinia oleae]